MSEANTMTQDEIIDMAETAGMTRDGDMWFSNGKSDMDVHISHLEAFAKLVDAKATAREREACAKLCDDIDKSHWGCEVRASWCSDAIRARGDL